MLLPIGLSRGERSFVLFCGLKGAVPILLGTYVLVEKSSRAGEIYDLIFIVVTVSVIVPRAAAPNWSERWRSSRLH